MSRRLTSTSMILALCLLFGLSGAASAAEPTITVHEAPIAPLPSSLSSRSREPIVATHPTDPKRIAVVYPRGDKSPSDVIRISHDGGKTWKTATGNPQGGGNHPAIAWGRGPKAGTARLYYIGLTSAGSGCCQFAISYSDNEGRSWKTGFVARNTKPWFGGFPELTTDNDPESPNYGVVYVAYNWPGIPGKSSGLRLLASSDYGRSFKGIEVPVAKTPKGYGDTWRIDYRVRTARDGSAYVAFYQRDVRVWNIGSPFSYGSVSNVGRIGFSVAHFTFDRHAKRFKLGKTIMAAKLARTSGNLGSGSPVVGLTDPMWSFGMDVDPETGMVFLAVKADGGVRIYRSADEGKTWTSKKLPQASPIGGRSQMDIRPQIVVGKGFVMVLLHTLDRSGSSRTVGNAYAVSYDHGATFGRPVRISAKRWKTGYFGGTYLGVGLRERALLTADRSTVFFAYGDGRTGRHSLSRVFGARITVTLPEDAPTALVPRPTPEPVPAP